MNPIFVTAEELFDEIQNPDGTWRETYKPESEPWRKYPQLRFPNEAVPSGRFKNLVDKACEGGLSPGLVVPALMCLASSLPLYDTMEGARINLYICLLAMVGAGKDTAIERAVGVLGLGEPGPFYSAYTPSGERSISNLIGDHAPKKGETARQPGPRQHCIVTYELEDTMNKSRGESSSVLQAMQWLYDHNNKTFSDSKKESIQTICCRLSWLTALPIGSEGEIDESAFPSVFGERSTHGITSRFLFGFAEEQFDRRKSRNWKPPSRYVETTIEIEDVTVVEPLNTVVGELKIANVEGFEDGVEAKYLAWQPETNASGRDTYHVLKVALVSALLSGHKKVAEDDWDFACAFMSWQEAIRETFMASKAKGTPQAQFNESVVRAVERQTEKLLAKGKKPDDCWIRWRKLSHDLKWYRHGMDVTRTIDNLVAAGALIYKVEEEEGQGRDTKQVADKKFVRLPVVRREG
jgi:hypothetical protein